MLSVIFSESICHTCFLMAPVAWPTSIYLSSLNLSNIVVFMLIHANKLTVDLSPKYFHILHFDWSLSDNRSKNAENNKSRMNLYLITHALWLVFHLTGLLLVLLVFLVAAEWNEFTIFVRFTMRIIDHWIIWNFLFLFQSSTIALLSARVVHCSNKVSILMEISIN